MSIQRNELRRRAEQDLDGSVRLIFEDEPHVALRSDGVARAVGGDEAAVRECLDRLEAAGFLERIHLEGDLVAWKRAGDRFAGRSDAGAYTITDERSGLVTRADSRSRALRRLADRIEQFERGDHVGAQVLGICESAISPAYLSGVEEILHTYVYPDNRHLYVYVQGEGVTEVTTAAQLSRDQRILGFTVTGRFDREEFSEVMLVSAETVIERTPITAADFPVGVFKVTAVHPDHQHEGIGTALGSHGLAYLAETPPVLTMLWGRDDGSNEGLAEKFDFDELARFENATPLDGHCPECGFENECTCSSLLYGWGYAAAD